MLCCRASFRKQKNVQFCRFRAQAWSCFHFSLAYFISDQRWLHCIWTAGPRKGRPTSHGERTSYHPLKRQTEQTWQKRTWTGSSRHTTLLCISIYVHLWNLLSHVRTEQLYILVSMHRSDGDHVTRTRADPHILQLLKSTCSLRAFLLARLGECRTWKQSNKMAKELR